MERSTPMKAPRKLKLLFAVIPSEKADYYSDLLQDQEVNLLMFLKGKGTASTELRHYLGLADGDKTVLIGVIREDRAPAALRLLEEKFRTLRNGKGIAYTVPMSGMIGVANYRFLSNTR